VRATRITYVGELGWELYVPAEFAVGVYEDLMSVGAELQAKQQAASTGLVVGVSSRRARTPSPSLEARCLRSSREVGAADIRSSYTPTANSAGTYSSQPSSPT